MMRRLAWPAVTFVFVLATVSVVLADTNRQTSSATAPFTLALDPGTPISAARASNLACLRTKWCIRHVT